MTYTKTNYPRWIQLVACLLWLAASTSLYAQENIDQGQRIKLLEALKEADAALDSMSTGVPAGIENIQLPPLQVFLDAVTENAAVKRAKSEVEEVKNDYRLQKRDWWNNIRLNGSYAYGRYNILSNNSDEYTPLYQTSMASAQHNFSVGVSVGIPLGDFTNRKLKLKKYRYDIEQLQYQQEEVMEERRLQVLEAYNQVTIQLATIGAKAETAALYNAQMKMVEYNFIHGKMTIESLAVERGRRSGAVTTYEQSRVELHNSIILLEMLTNVKIIKD